MLSEPSGTYNSERLVDAIEQRLGRMLDPQVRNAFLRVPRHLFLDHYYRQQGNRLTWDYIAEPTRAEIYRDEALVTHIDVQGFPISSSSQPSVMARQLELLDLRPGLSVLEIGTGTGYNAALLGTLVGPTGRVTSIDIDSALVETAHHHLQAAGITNVLANTGDGFQGCSEHAPYDRFLATCAVRKLPRQWVEQLAPDGLLLTNLRFHLSSVFLLLKKHTPTTLEGCLFDFDAAYMEMQDITGWPSVFQVDWEMYDSLPRHEMQLPASLTELLTRPAYSVLLECLLPNLRKKYRAVPEGGAVQTYLIDSAVPGSAIQVQGNHATIIGTNEHLKTHLLQSMEWYERIGVTMEDYTISLDERGVMLCFNEMCFSLHV